MTNKGISFQSQNLFFYSDPHFGHKNVIKFTNRPFDDIHDMEAKMIALYNKTVPKDGIVIWVGDCFFTKIGVAMDIMKKLNGTKILVRGNHDMSPSQMYRIGFSYVCDASSIKIGEYHVDIKHYPFKPKFSLVKRLRYWIKRIKGERINELRYMDRRPENRGQWLIHGHTHSAERVKDRMIHVGVDAWGFKPVSFREIEGIIAKAEKAKK